MVILFGRFGPEFAEPNPDDVAVYYLAGDTNFGRAMKLALLDEESADRVAGAVLSRTKKRPLVVNLEGVILPNVPQAIDDLTLAMPEDLTVAWLKRLNVVGAGLANNHSLDLGLSGYAETTRALEAADIRWFGQGDLLDLPGLDIVGLSDLDTNGSPQVDLIGDALLDRLIREDGERPVVAFVHWGREYAAEPSGREKALADAMRLRSATVIVGAHPHVASSGIVAHGGGDTAEVYSLGNFLFDQTAARGSSGQLVELRVFGQGTVFVRTLELPNLFDLAGP
jgi:poly-gamma-glutamate synthesis protein (capsule biosynthesis protein)